MPGLAFISYRRDDTSQIAQPLYLQLKQEFGSGQLFMDVHSIRAGEMWPDRVQRRLQDATVLLTLIGPGWLTAADKYGRRRIDDPADWVRNEIVYALQHRIAIIPIVINHTQNLPDPAGLPPELGALSFTQAMILRLDPAEWTRDVAAISNLLLDYRLRRDPLPAQPAPSPKKRDTAALNEQELADALKTLPEWEEWTDSLPIEYPRVRQELRRTLTFKNFNRAIAFMSFVAPRFQAKKHHPRWINEWNTVRIRLTTWDAGNKITHYDVDAAHMVDDAYREFNAGN
jgi:pterin-4a-carbinolamine dehydratase